MKPVVIGILGGVGSGKTTVSRMFESLGATVVDADNLAHEVLETPEIAAGIRRIWGENVFTNNAVDRKKLARVVFPSKAEVAKLESLVHPPVKARIESIIAEYRKTCGFPALILDAPLLVETGFDRICDVLVFVEAGPEIRSNRAAGRGLTPKDVETREKLQISLDSKRRMAHHVVENNSSEALTFQQVSAIWGLLHNLPVS